MTRAEATAAVFILGRAGMTRATFLSSAGQECPGYLFVPRVREHWP